MQDIDIIHSIYASFNTRQADAVLVHFHEDVQWPNGWKGGVLNGKNEVREYWLQQWSEINPVVTPENTIPLPDGRLQVRVHQIVKELNGNLIFDGRLDHTYTFTEGLVTKMEID